MKNNWLITQAVVGLVVSPLCVCTAGLEQPAPDPTGDELGYPTNELIALELGRADATRDVTHGVLRIPIYGSPIEWTSDFSRILEEKYNIDRYGLGGPSITPGLTEYARGYAEISERAIKEKFGANFFERVQAEAKNAHEQRMQTQAAAPATSPVAITTPPVAAPVVETPVAAPAPATASAVAIPTVAASVIITQNVETSTVPIPVVAQASTPTNRTYRVKAGDTFWEIARQHHVPVSSLVAANPGVNPSKLQINYNLNVPPATRP